MVRGLGLFRDHFAPFSDCYALIGGTACDLALSHAGLNFRSTRDLDIVLCTEEMSTDFAQAFWWFVAAGMYQSRHTDGSRRYHRFTAPGIDDFPQMIELFSRSPDTLAAASTGQLTPIPIDGPSPASQRFSWMATTTTGR